MLISYSSRPRLTCQSSYLFRHLVYEMVLKSIFLCILEYIQNTLSIVNWGVENINIQNTLP